MHHHDGNPGLERAHFELRASGVKAEPSNSLRSGIHDRGYLPHVKREGASYFVTFRLADSLPRTVLMQFAAEKAARLRQLESTIDKIAVDAIQTVYVRKNGTISR